MTMEFDETVTKDLLRQTQEIITVCPSRLTGSSLCKKSAELIAEKLRKYCDAVAIEEFDVHPGSFLGFMRFQAVAYLISTIFFFQGGVWIWLAAIGYTLANINSLSQFVYYKEIFDPFYKKVTGHNVVGSIEPAGEVQQQILIAGHHDTAYVFNYLLWMQKLYAVRITLGIVTMIIAMVCTWLGLILEAITNAPPFYAQIMPYFLIIGFFFVGELYFFHGKEGVPGAGDNLIASVMVIKLAEIFGTAKAKGAPLLQHTRLLLHSYDAEEAGLRGARAYVKKHLHELVALPTYVLNVDSIFDINEIHFLTSDVNGFLRLSSTMAQECTEVAKELGYHTQPVPMTFGGGATDAAEYAKVGVESTTLIALSTKMIRDNLIYHTPKDTVENLDPKAIEAAFTIVYRYVVKKDSRP